MPEQQDERDLTPVERKHVHQALRRALTEPSRGAANLIRLIQNMEEDIAELKKQVDELSAGKKKATKKGSTVLPPEDMEVPDDDTPNPGAENAA